MARMEADNMADRTTYKLRKARLLKRIATFLDAPLMLLALVSVPMIAGLFLWENTRVEVITFSVIAVGIWSIFVADLAIRLYLTPSPMAYMRHNWHLPLSVLLPFLRPLQVLRLGLRCKTLDREARTALSVRWLAVIATGLVFLSATLMITLERNAGSNFDSFGDSIWWVIVTVSTVGYGDTVPGTTAGRLIAIVVMICGIGIFSALAGSLSSYLNSGKASRRSKEDSRHIRQLMAQVKVLSESVEAMRSNTHVRPAGNKPASSSRR